MRRETPDILGELMSAQPAAPTIPTAMPAEFTREQWEQFGHQIAVAQTKIQFVIGDWILAGERQYGDVYADAERITGHKYQFLADCVYVCRAWQFSSRDENLTWSHHKALAALPDDEKPAALRHVREHQLSVAATRSRFDRSARPPAPPVDEIPPGEPVTVHDAQHDVDPANVEIVPTVTEICDVISSNLKEAGNWGDPERELAALSATHALTWRRIVGNVYAAADGDDVDRALNRLNESAAKRRQFRQAADELGMKPAASVAPAADDPMRETFADQIQRISKFLHAELPGFDQKKYGNVADRTIAAITWLLQVAAGDDEPEPEPDVEPPAATGPATNGTPDWRAGWDPADQSHYDVIAAAGGWTCDEIRRARVALRLLEKEPDPDLRSVLLDCYYELEGRK